MRRGVSKRTELRGSRPCAPRATSVAEVTASKTRSHEPLPRVGPLLQPLPLPPARIRPATVA
eukprot:700260-Pleurochrysis_carterae.AAC.1